MTALAADGVTECRSCSYQILLAVRNSPVILPPSHFGDIGGEIRAGVAAT
jgi:hypothetical protein